MRSAYLVAVFAGLAGLVLVVLLLWRLVGGL
jgi:hypothetical protein